MVVKDPWFKIQTFRLKLGILDTRCKVFEAFSFARKSKISAKSKS